MDEFKKAMEDVLDYGMDVIDNLTPEQLKMISEMFGEEK